MSDSPLHAAHRVGQLATETVELEQTDPVLARDGPAERESVVEDVLERRLGSSPSRRVSRRGEDQRCRLPSPA
jgi:hypothetical protein